MSRTIIDIADLLSPEHRSYLDGLPSKYAAFRGWELKKTDDDDDEEDDDSDDDDEDGPIELDPDDIIKVGEKEMKVSDLQRIAAKEKREGKKAGQRAVLQALGFESLEDAQAALKGAGKPKAKKTDDADDDRATERETAAEARERKAAERERRADLRGALRDHGVSRGDLDDALALLDRAVDTEYDEDDLEDAVDELKGRRPGLFGSDDSDSDDDERPAPKAKIPNGRGPQRRNKPKRKFGQGGYERAKRDGFIKD